MRRFTLLLVLPTMLVCVLSIDAHSQDFYYFNNKQDSVPIWTKKFADSLTKEFSARGFTIPQWPDQQVYPKFFENPSAPLMPNIPLPDIRGNIQALPRVIPKSDKGSAIPNYPGWRYQKLSEI